MNVLKVKEGYINSEGDIKICKRENATVFASIRDALRERDRIYLIKPMIGKISTEVIK